MPGYRMSIEKQQGILRSVAYSHLVNNREMTLLG